MTTDDTDDRVESRRDGDLQMSRRSALKTTGILGLLGAGLGTASADSTGEADTIETWTDLDRVRDDLDGTYTLAARLDETTEGYGGDGEDGVVLNADGELRDGVGFDPIGSFDDPFTGTFEGNGYTISGLEISTDSNNSGLFAANYGTIRDVALVVEIEGDNDSVGGIAGAVESPGRIVNSLVTGTIEGNNKVGGIVGLLLDGGSIKGSSAGCDVSGTSLVGGLVGEATVEDSTQTNIEIRRSHATGAVTGTGDNIGGLAGRLGGVNVENCYATGSVDGSDWVGGFVGYGSVPQIRSCFAAGDVSGDEALGGFAGHTAWSENQAKGQNFDTGRVTRCYATGNVSGGSIAGGFTGMGSRTFFSYSIGDVSGSSDLGGFAGGTFTESGYSYWDIPASGLRTSAGPNYTTRGIGEPNETPPADDMVGDGIIGGDFRNLRVRDEFETVEASDSDVSEDGYPVLSEIDRKTQLEARGGVAGPPDADKSVTVAPDGDLAFSPADLTVDPGTTVAFEWDAGGHTVTVDSQPDDASWSGADSSHDAGYTHTHTFDVAGGTYEYYCRFHKQNMQGTITAWDGSESPKAVFSTTKKSGTTVSFDASGSASLNGSITSYEWDFGDGSTASGETVEHTFDKPGYHDVTLTVTEDTGNTGEETKELEVGETHEILIQGLNSQGGNYEFSVTGTVKGGDNTDGSTASGTIYVHEDRYRYGGEITSWYLDEEKPVRIFIDGERVDRSSLGPSEVDKSVTVAPNGDLAFSPANLTVSPGDTVAFEWDADGHTVTVDSQPDDAGWSGADASYDAGYTNTHTFDVEGTYEYYCRPHQSQMQGTITVGDADEPEPIPEAIDEDDDGEIDDDEILDAVEHWTDEEPVPGTDGETIGDQEILDLIDSWQDGESD